MENYIIYNKSTGKIEQVGNGDIELYRGIITDMQDIMIGNASIDDAINTNTGEIIEGGASAFITYAENRMLAYPSYTAYLDAQVKLSSPDPDIVAEGEAQLNKYYADCLAVKARFPKE